MEIRDLYVWLSIANIPIRKVREFALSFDSVLDIWELNRYDSNVMRHLSGKEFQALMECKNSLPKVLEDMKSKNIKFITEMDKEYPECFKNMELPPICLYYIGDVTLLSGKNIAVIGTRRCTRYGKEQTHKFSIKLAKEGFNITSGLAEGIDSYAIEGAHIGGGKAIAVLGGGLKYIYPAINVSLAAEIVKNGGLLISETPPDYRPKQYTFIQRDRLIAAIVDGVLIVEAGQKSGALYTANFALDCGKELFAIPGNCNSPSSVGCNNLIKQFYTCCVTEPEEIINVLNSSTLMRAESKDFVERKPCVDKVETLSNEEKIILGLLKVEELHLEELALKTQFNPKKLITLLTTMEFRGLIRKLPGNNYGLKG